MTVPGTRKHDATGRSAGFKKDHFAFNSPPADEPWVWFTRSMLTSDAWRAMPLVARKVVDRIILEHMAHAGTTNGELIVTYDDFVAFGIRRSSINEGIAIAVALGFLDLTVHGARSYGARRLPSQYGLTWLGRSDHTPPSNRWHHIDAANAKKAVASLRLSGRRARGPHTGDIYSSPTLETGEVPQISATAGRKSETGRASKVRLGNTQN